MKPGGTTPDWRQNVSEKVFDTDVTTSIRRYNVKTTFTRRLKIRTTLQMTFKRPYDVTSILLQRSYIINIHTTLQRPYDVTISRRSYSIYMTCIVKNTFGCAVSFIFSSNVIDKT